MASPGYTLNGFRAGIVHGVAQVPVGVGVVVGERCINRLHDRSEDNAPDEIDFPHWA